MRTRYFSILIVCLSVLYTLSISAQNDYQPMLDETAVWNFERTIECEPYTPYYNFKYSLVFSGDTAINEVGYQKLVRPAWEFFAPGWFNGTLDDCDESVRPKTGYLGALREDIDNKKVYYIPTGESEEILLYDFTMETGDTLTSYFPDWILNAEETFIVHSIDSVLINDSFHLRWIIHYESMPEDGMPLQIIEGIGGLYGLVDPDPFFFMHSPSTDLMCYTNADNDLFPADAGSCNVITNIEELANYNAVVVFPNPANGNLSLQLPENLNSSSAVIQISDLTGRMVWEQNTSLSTRVEINTSHWTKGLYLVRVSSDEMEYSARFVVQ